MKRKQDPLLCSLVDRLNQTFVFLVLIRAFVAISFLRLVLFRRGSVDQQDVACFDAVDDRELAAVGVPVKGNDAI